MALDTVTKPTPAAETPMPSADSMPQATARPRAEPSSFRDTAQMVAALCLAGGVLVYLVFFAAPGKTSPEPEASRPPANEPVKLVDERLIQIQAGHALEQKLQIVAVE